MSKRVLLSLFFVGMINTSAHASDKFRLWELIDTHDRRSAYPEKPIRLFEYDGVSALYTDSSLSVINHTSAANTFKEHLKVKHKKSTEVLPEEGKQEVVIDFKARRSMMEKQGQELDGITPLMYCAVTKKPQPVLDALLPHDEKRYRDRLRVSLQSGVNPLARACVYNIETHVKEGKEDRYISITESLDRASGMVYDAPALCMLLAAEKRWEQYPAMQELVRDALNGGDGVAGMVVDYCAGDSVELVQDEKELIKQQEELVQHVVKMRGYPKEYVLEKLKRAREYDGRESKEEAQKMPPVTPAPAKKNREMNFQVKSP